MRSDSGKTFSRDGIGDKGNGQANVGRALAQSVMSSPQVVIKPEDATVQFGKEVTISIIDGQVRPSDESALRLEYDPNVLQFKRLDDAELLTRKDEILSDTSGDGTATIIFRLARPAGREPRTVGVTFLGKASGVSPVRVELMDSGRPGQVSLGVVGAGVVRVR